MTAAHPRFLVFLDYFITSNAISTNILPYFFVFPCPSKQHNERQANELCSDRALRSPTVARCAAPLKAVPMSFSAFHCLHPKRDVALLNHSG